MDLRKLLGLPDLIDAKRVVCVQPHPDDTEVGAGGTLIQLAKRNCDITIVTVTDGGAGTSSQGTDTRVLVSTRKAEKELAGQMMGVSEQIDLNFPDAGDYQYFDVFAKLVPVFRAKKPDVVITVDPWMPYEAHPDHIKTGKAVAAAALFSDNGVLFPSEFEPVAVPQVAFYATSYPNCYVDITSTFDEKLEAMRTHKSQFDSPEWPILAMFLREQAKQLHCKWKPEAQTDGLAEAFKLLSTRQLHFFPSAVYD